MVTIMIRKEKHIGLFLVILYSMMNMLNNRLLYIAKFLRVNFKCSHNKNMLNICGDGYIN